MEIKQTEKLVDLVNQATKIELTNRDLTLEQSDYRNLFLEEISRSNPNISGIIAKKKKTPEEKELLRSWNKTQSKKFKTVLKFLAPKENTDPINTLAETISNLIQYSRYLGHTELEKVLAEKGIELNFPDLETENPYFSDQTVRSNIAKIFSMALNTQTEISKNKTKISDDLYEELDDSVKFSSSNLSGLKSSQFKKLVEIKINAKMYPSPLYSVFLNKIKTQTEAEIKSKTTFLEQTSKV